MFTVTNISGNPSYAEDIFNIDSLCFPGDSWSYELISRELRDNKVIYFVCTENSKVIGYLCASVVLDELTLERIGVLEQYRKNGIGKKLIEKLVDFALSINAVVINLEVRSKNYGAIYLYSKCNFTFDTIRKKYYQNPSDDAVLMSLKL